MVVPGGLLLVLRFYLVDFELVMGLSLPVHIPISLFQFGIQCGLGGVFG